MSDKHTPGPWAAFRKSDGSYGVRTNGQKEAFHMIVATTVWDEEYASLIAAAPDLLAALIAITTLRCVGMDIAPINDAYDMASAAIAKATGGAS